MIFNFFLGNHHADALNSLADLLRPIYCGLIEAGHHVIGFGTGVREAPVVNVLVEWFENDPFADALLQQKASGGDKFIFGVLCTEDMSDQLVMDPTKYPGRLANLRRILPVADFVWTLLPQKPFFDSVCGSDHVTLVEYGFSPRYLDPNIIKRPERRDVDAILYGNDSPYRSVIVKALAERKVTCFVSNREAWPSYMTDDIIRRSKVLIDLRRGPNVRFLSPTRISKGLHCGVAVASELFDRSEIASLYSYTEPCPYDALAERSVQIIRSGSYVETGLTRLAKFQAETSMRDNMTRALALPIFDRLSKA
jgi:hypothetical protein